MTMEDLVRITNKQIIKKTKGSACADEDSALIPDAILLTWHYELGAPPRSIICGIVDAKKSAMAAATSWGFSCITCTGDGWMDGLIAQHEKRKKITRIEQSQERSMASLMDGKQEKNCEKQSVLTWCPARGTTTIWLLSLKERYFSYSS